MERLIFRDEALLLITDLPVDSTDAETLQRCIEVISNMPTVDAVPVKHGRWIDIDSETYTWKIRCSNCGHERSMMSTGQIYPMYCENCGTRMDWKDSDDEKAD